MKDIAQDGLDLGLSEANKLLAKRVARGRMTPAKMGDILNSIDPTLTYAGFEDVDIVVEAVVENAKVKGMRTGRDREAYRQGCGTGLQYLHHLHHPPGGKPGAPGKLLRHALLQPGTRHAAGRGDSR